jgi:6-phosphogluconolactonase (cycloisomerase 2 family)
MSFAYVGSRTTRERNARGDGITVYRLDAARGQLETVQVVGDLVNPSFLALNRRGDMLYTVHGDREELSVLRVDTQQGTLQHVQTCSCEGRNPVHLALDPTGRHMVVSNHLTGALAVLPVRDDGTLGPVSQLAALEGTPGPHRVEQPFSKPHFNPFDPSGRFVIVPDKGLDRLFSFRFEDGRLAPAAVPHAQARENAGPRHVAFHPTAPYVYSVNELDSTVTAYRLDPQSGALAPLQILSTLPDTFTGNSRASEIVVDARGRTLYASNRGDDSIAIFRLDPATGRMAFLRAQAATGRTPRFFILTPDGRFMFVLNEDSDSIVAFAVDQDSGALEPTGWSIGCGSPVCMVFSPASS